MIAQLLEHQTLVYQETTGQNLAKGILLFSFLQIQLPACQTALNLDGLEVSCHNAESV